MEWFNKFSDLKLQFHSVVRQLHAGRQRRVGCLVRQVVTNVREKCTLRFYRFNNFQRLLDGRMSGMRRVAQRVQKQNVESAQFLQRFGGDFAVIRQVSRRSEPETENRGVAVNHRQWLEARAEEFDAPFDQMQVDLRQSAKLIRWFKNVREHVAQEFASAGRGIKRQLARLMVISQGAQVVDAEDVVGVRVGVEHGIELPDVFAQRLFPKVGRA